MRTLSECKKVPNGDKVGGDGRMQSIKRKAVVAEGIFNGFLAFMMVMAISTIFLFGVKFDTIVASLCGSVELFGVVWRAIH